MLVERIDSDAGGSLRLSNAGGFVQIERQEVAAGPLFVARTRDDELALEGLVAWAFQREPLPVDILWQVCDP